MTCPKCNTRAMSITGYDKEEGMPFYKCTKCSYEYWESAYKAKKNHPNGFLCEECRQDECECDKVGTKVKKSCSNCKHKKGCLSFCCARWFEEWEPMDKVETKVKCWKCGSDNLEKVQKGFKGNRYCKNCDTWTLDKNWTSDKIPEVKCPKCGWVHGGRHPEKCIACYDPNGEHSYYEETEVKCPKCKGVMDKVVPPEGGHYYVCRNDSCKWIVNKDDTETIEVDIPDEDFLILAKAAHEQDITLNQFMNNVLIKAIEKENKSFKVYRENIRANYAKNKGIITYSMDNDYNAWLERKLYDMVYDMGYGE